jgi:Fe-S cluster assembly protein SufD
MNIAVAKTAAETKLSESFDRIADTLPGDAAVADARRAALGTFTALGLPHRRIEEWKYSDVRRVMSTVGEIANGTATANLTEAAVNAALGPLAGALATRIVIVDGVHAPALSSSLPDGVTVRTFADAVAAEDGALTGAFATEQDKGEALVALNLALATGGVAIDIAAGTELDDAIGLVIVRSTGNDGFTSVRNSVTVGDKANATLVEAYVSADGAAGGQSNAVTRVAVGAQAEFTHVKLVTEAEATHLGTLSSVTDAESNYRPFFYTAGAGFVRNNLFQRFAGADAKLDCSGAFLANGNQHIDNTLTIDHAVPGCEGRELFKGVLDDNARGVFQGKVIVRQIAQKTDGKQMAQALMLSPTCEFDSKPELEIYADDVLCGHGSTCAELDPELIFYLRSRGIEEATARALLMDSFIGEAIECVEHEAVSEALGEMARSWLKANGARG